MLAWARVYFYAVIGVAACSGFLASPGKAWLQKKVKARNGSGRPQLQKADSFENMSGATLGVPSEPGQEFDEMVDEIVEEVRKRKGQQAFPDAQELRRRVETALKRETSDEKRSVKEL